MTAGRGDRGFEPVRPWFEPGWRRAGPRVTMLNMGEIPITVKGDVAPRAVEQLRRCAEAGDAVAGALCADGHVGYSQPIGGVLAYPDHISPSGVGYDIGCVARGTPVTTQDGYALPVQAVAANTPVT
jgi:tRNA-splicing ligase RtcB